jgi:hypothetical protein
MIACMQALGVDTVAVRGIPPLRQGRVHVGYACGYPFVAYMPVL